MKLKIILFLSIFSKSIFGQTTTGTIVYTQIDTFGVSYDVKLYFGEQRSVYVYNRGAKIKHRVIMSTGEELDMKNLERFSQQIKQGMINIYYVDEEGEVIYKDWAGDSMVIRDINEFDPLLVSESKIPTINWSILTQTKQIGKFTCQKATTRFRGRNYEAWFSPEIPVSAGPWKLHGLPGLILEANDDEKKFQYKFQSIEIPLVDKMALSKIPKSGLRVPLRDYYDVSLKSKAEHLRAKLSSMKQGALISTLPPTIQRQELTFD